MLLGLTLPDGWVVKQQIDRPPGATGANFSVGYVVERNGQTAFLKAFDYRQAFEQEDPAPMLAMLTSAYNFERELLERCARERLSRIVRALASGAIRIKEQDPRYVVQYVIFELAEGDVRAFLNIRDKANLAWKLRILHQLTTGIAQLHSRLIAHQDVKPSNILIFGTIEVKLADLGCASVKDQASPRDGKQVPGAWSYAAPELIYRFNSPDWEERRLAPDLYLLGSMVVFFFTGLGATKLLLLHLDEGHRPEVWKGFFHDALPFLIDAFEKLLVDVRDAVPAPFKEDVVAIVRQLCFPDPSRRGHPRARAQVGSPYALERYVSEFNLLSAKAEIALRKTL